MLRSWRVLANAALRKGTEKGCSQVECWKRAVLRMDTEKGYAQRMDGE